MAFARQQLGDKPVTALVFTHSHIDHFGGALGIVSPKDGDRQVPVVASNGFMEEATSENVMVGTAMGRRSSYQFGVICRDQPKAMWTRGTSKERGVRHLRHPLQPS
jgi:alkyl sulfatase BDS1-like metallo-beta-lactamase superfamily hydrolase